MFCSVYLIDKSHKYLSHSTLKQPETWSTKHDFQGSEGSKPKEHDHTIQHVKSFIMKRLNVVNSKSAVDDIIGKPL